MVGFYTTLRFLGNLYCILTKVSSSVFYQYAYLLMTLVFLIIWLFIYLKREDLRYGLLFAGVIVGFLSLVTAYLFWTVDWWQPPTFTNTRVGLEDFILGFTNGGIAVSLYDFIFNKRVVRTSNKHDLGGFTILILFATSISALFWFLHLTSFWACTISLGLVGTLLTLLKPSLFINSLVNSVLMVVLVVPFYWVANMLFPFAVEEIYKFKTLSHTLLTGIPIEELIFYFIFGFVAPIFYKYWKGVEYI